MADEKKDKPEKDMQKEYELVKRKYALPDYSALDKEFSFGQLEPTDFVLRGVLSKMHDRLDYSIKILHAIIQPENDLADMQEAEHFSDSEKKQVQEMFKRLSFYEKEFLIADFDYSDEAAASLINQFAREWLRLKPDYLNLLRTMRETWKSRESARRNDASYFG